MSFNNNNKTGEKKYDTSESLSYHFPKLSHVLAIEFIVQEKESEES